MLTAREKQIIIEYWFRTLTVSNISTIDIYAIILNFAKVYEAFVICPGSVSTEIANEGTSMTKTDGTGKESDIRNVGTIFGTVKATPGPRTYHWRFKIVKCVKQDINIGVIAAHLCDDTKYNSGWWGHEYNHCYRDYWCMKIDSGRRWNYGDPTKHDIFDMWLDMNPDHRKLSFATNDEEHRKVCQVQESMDYRLAITVYGDGYQIELISFEVY